MKYKLAALAVMLLAAIGGTFTINEAYAADQIDCPPGSVRNTVAADGTETVAKVNNIAECNIPKNETDAAGNEKNAIYFVTKVINVVLGALGIITVAVIIIGAIGFITSQGDSSKVTKSKNAVLYGIIGLVIALLAYAIVNFVLKGVFGGTTTP